MQNLEIKSSKDNRIVGFKAPLAYSSSFYFIARKDGVERKYMMYEGEDTNSIDLLHEQPTTEGNGVKVIIPVDWSDRYNFYSKIKEQLAYFESVYFDVELIGSYNVPNDFTIHRAEHFQYSSLSNNGSMHLCLDNVSYPIDWEKLGIPQIDIKLALRFSLSDGLFPTPNREAIRYTQEAKKTILKKIVEVANVFMIRFNDSITIQSDIKTIIEFYSKDKKYINSWYKDDNSNICIDRLLEHATIPIEQPKIENVKLLNLERLAIKSKEYILAEYKFKYKFSNSVFKNSNDRHCEYLKISDLTKSSVGDIYIYNDVLSKSKQNYLRTLLPNNKTIYFVKKSPFKLRSRTGQTDYAKYYDSVLNLSNYPKEQWVPLIREFRYVVGLYQKDFIDADAIDVPQSFKDAQKAKRMKVTVAAVTGPKKVRMKGEFSGKVGTDMQVNMCDQYCKFVPITFKMEDIHKTPKLYIYGKECDKKQLDRLWSAFNKQAKFVIVAQATFDNLQKVDLHNWITIDKFMQGKNRPFKTIATEFLIQELLKNKQATFQRTEIVREISNDLADKLEILNKYNQANNVRYADQHTILSVVEYAKEHNLFDQPIYMVYNQVNEVFTKLPFLNVLLEKLGYQRGKTDDNFITAIVDLFKYHKQKVNLNHYIIRLTEDAPLEETLTEDTINELQTI